MSIRARQPQVQAAAAAVTYGWDYTPPSSDLPPRKLALTAAVLATTLAIFVPQVPQKEFQDGWRNKWQEPVQFLQAKRSVALLGGVTSMPPRVADKEFIDGWRSKHQEPVPLAPRSMALGGGI